MLNSDNYDFKKNGLIGFNMPNAILEDINCQICGSKNYRLLFELCESRDWWKAFCADEPDVDVNMVFKLVSCKRCGTAYVNPRLRSTISARIYANYWKSRPQKLSSDEYVKYILSVLDKLEGRPRLLDFGCGWGRYLYEAERTGWDAIGLEVDEAKREWCSENRLNAICGDILDSVRFQESSFDSVIAHQVFEHLYNPKDYLQELSRILKPGGILYISVPNYGGLKSKLRKKNWTMLHPASHVTYFDAMSLKHLLNMCGFAPLSPPYARRHVNFLRSILYNINRIVVEQYFNIHLFGLSFFARNEKAR